MMTLRTAILLSVLLLGSQGPALAQAVPGSDPVPGAEARTGVEAEEGVTAQAAQAGPAARRAAVARFLAQGYARAATESAGGLHEAMPADEALAGLARLSDDEIAVIHEALPIIGHWEEAQANLRSRAAQGPGVGSPVGLHGSAASDESLDEIRQGLAAMLDVQEGWAETIGDLDPAYGERLAGARQALAGATEEDLTALREGLSLIPDWQRTLAPDLTAITGPAGLAPPAAWRGKGATSPDGLAVTLEQCSEADYSRNVLPLIIAQFAMEGTRILASYASIFAAEDIKICVGLIVAVVCVDFPNPIFFILKFVEFAASRARDGLEAAVLVAGVCTSIKHWQATVTHRTDFLLEAQAVMRSLILRDNEIVQRAERIDFTNREAWKLHLQLDIEANLLEPDPRPDGSDENRKSLYQLTDTVCFNPDHLLPTPVAALPTPALTDPAADVAPPPVLEPLPTPVTPFIVPDPREQCGLLLVKRIVEEAILLNKMAGNDVHNADDAYAAAMVHLNANRYKLAYLRFREAYRDAVQPDAEPRLGLRGMPEVTGR